MSKARSEVLQKRCALAKEVLEMTGRLRISEVALHLDTLPAMRELLKKERVEFSLGMNHPWQHWLANWEVPEQEEGASIDVFLDQLATRRVASLIATADCLEEEFQKQHPSVDLNAWRLVLLRGCWLRESVIISGGRVVVSLDSTFAFEERGQDVAAVNPDVVV